MRVGKVRYYGLSNAPAWYVTRFATLAAAQGLPEPVGMQLEYSLVERHVEREHVPAARELGLGVQPWSPLAGGFLTGKYHAHDPANIAGQRPPELPDRPATEDPSDHSDSDGRLRGANPFGDAKFTERNWRILHAVYAVADATGRTPAEVALAWVVRQPGIVSPLIGASRTAQLQQNVAALDVTLDSSHLAMLDDVSALEAVYPYTIFTPTVRRMVFGGADVQGWHYAWATP